MGSDGYGLHLPTQGDRIIEALDIQRARCPDAGIEHRQRQLRRRLPRKPPRPPAPRRPDRHQDTLQGPMAMAGRYLMVAPSSVTAAISLAWT